MRTYKTEGVVLKRTNFGEADRLLTLYTKHQGKLKVLAKGARKTTSRKAGSLELFSLVNFSLAEGRNLDIVTEASVVNLFPSLRGDLKKVGVAFYFCELVDKLTVDNQENGRVYELLVTNLAKIGKRKYRQLVFDFEKEILVRLGFGVPESLKNNQNGLRGYLEEVSERAFSSPKIVREFFLTKKGGQSIVNAND